MYDSFITRRGQVITPLGTTPFGGDVHESLRFDPRGNLLDLHLTARIPGGRSTHIYPQNSSQLPGRIA